MVCVKASKQVSHTGLFPFVNGWNCAGISQRDLMQRNHLCCSWRELLLWTKRWSNELPVLKNRLVFALDKAFVSRNLIGRIAKVLDKIDVTDLFTATIQLNALIDRCGWELKSAHFWPRLVSLIGLQTLDRILVAVLTVLEQHVRPTGFWVGYSRLDS